MRPYEMNAVGHVWQTYSDFSNPQFLKHPDNSNQKSFPLDLFHCKFTPDISNHFSVPLEVREIRINNNSTVLCNKDYACLMIRLRFK